MDWVATAVTFFSLFCYGRKCVIAGGTFGAIGSAIWVLWAFDGDLWSIVAVNVVLLLIHTYNAWRVYYDPFD